MPSRRQVLKLSAVLSAVALAGCNGPSPDDETPTDSDMTPQPGTDTSTTTEPSGEGPIDIRNFGAKVDGKTDDTMAVMDAIEAASSGDTVFFPPGTTVVSARHDTGRSPNNGAGPAIYLDQANSGITLAGAGQESVIKMAPDHPKGKKSFVLQVDCRADVKGVEIRDLTVDGNKQQNPEYTTIGVLCWPGGGVNDVTVQNVWARNCSENGIQLEGAGTRTDHCTAVDNMRHGFLLDNASKEQEPLVTATNILSRNNGGLGVNHSDGSAVLDGFFISGNGQGGMKFTADTHRTTIRNGIFAGNETMGLRYNGKEPPSAPIEVTVDNVVADGNQWAGFWLAGNAKYNIGTILARGNNASKEQHGNIEILAEAAVTADRIMSFDARSGTGLYYASTKSSAISTYQSAGNPDGPLTGPTIPSLKISNLLDDIQGGIYPLSETRVGAGSSSQFLTDI